jgi:NAD-dependent dihydropyrimidine dehydrogenase PreA subunit
MAFVIAEPCIGTKDTACVDACPVDCIHPKKNTTYDDARPGFDEVPQLYIDPIECIDCGACVPVCPVSAIFALDDLPEKWRHYTEMNASYVQGGKFTPEEYAKHNAAKQAPKRSQIIHRAFEAFLRLVLFVLPSKVTCRPATQHEAYPWLKSASPSSPPKNLIAAASSSISCGRSPTAITLRLVQIASPGLMF